MNRQIDRTEYLPISEIEKAKGTIITLLQATEREGIEELIDFLENKSDFFVAPASTKFHGNFRGGLAVHSLNVLHRLNKKRIEFKLSDVSETNVIIAALLHDLCKTNVYNKVTWSFKDSSGYWCDYKTYQFNDELPLGHGEKSVIMAQRYIKLEPCELYMIRWHMGAFEEGDNRQLYSAMDKIPCITAMMSADMEASTFLDVVINHKGE